MKFLQKIEDAINAVFEVILSKLWAFLCKLTPQFLVNFKDRMVLKVQFYGQQLINKSIKWITLIKEKTLSSKEKVTAKIQQIKEYDFKAKIESIKTEIKENILASPLTYFQKYWMKVKETYQIYANRYLTKRFYFLLKLTTGSLIIFLIGFNFIYRNSQPFMQNDSADRSLASVEEDLQYERKVYYKSEEKIFKLFNLSLPIEIEELTHIKSIKFDLSIMTSNRYIVLFFKNNEEALLNHIISNLLPTVSTYPLNEEGEEIIKTLLKNEINNFLKDHKIQGHIEEVLIWGYDAY